MSEAVNENLATSKIKRGYRSEVHELINQIPYGNLDTSFALYQTISGLVEINGQYNHLDSNYLKLLLKELPDIDVLNTLTSQQHLDLNLGDLPRFETRRIGPIARTLLTITEKLLSETREIIRSSTLVVNLSPLRTTVTINPYEIVPQPTELVSSQYEQIDLSDGKSFRIFKQNNPGHTVTQDGTTNWLRFVFPKRNGIKHQARFAIFNDTIGQHLLYYEGYQQKPTSPQTYSY